jgi:DNA-binding transcriptional LysR family regulator
VPADLDDLSGHDIICYDKYLASMPSSQWIEARLANATVVLRNREMSEMVAAAASGVGLAMLPCQMAELEPTLRRLTPKVLATRELTLLYRREPVISDELRAVIRFVVRVVRDNAAALAGGRRQDRS